MKNGCNGVAKNVMNWPAEMILGGIRQVGKNIEADGIAILFITKLLYFSTAISYSRCHSN
jgi:hypothetical protein